MNKKDLIDAVAGTTGSTATEAAAHLEAALEHIGAALAKGESVAIAGFGTFEVRHRAARTGRNPQTGAEIAIAASNAPAFKAAAALKRRVAD